MFERGSISKEVFRQAMKQFAPLDNSIDSLNDSIKAMLELASELNETIVDKTTKEVHNQVAFLRKEANNIIAEIEKAKKTKLVGPWDGPARGPGGKFVPRPEKFSPFQRQTRRDFAKEVTAKMQTLASMSDSMTNIVDKLNMSAKERYKMEQSSIRLQQRTDRERLEMFDSIVKMYNEKLAIADANAEKIAKSTTKIIENIAKEQKAQDKLRMERQLVRKDDAANSRFNALSQQLSSNTGVISKLINLMSNRLAPRKAPRTSRVAGMSLAARIARVRASGHGGMLPTSSRMNQFMTVISLLIPPMKALGIAFGALAGLVLVAANGLRTMANRALNEGFTVGQAKTLADIAVSGMNRNNATSGLGFGAYRGLRLTPDEAMEITETATRALGGISNITREVFDTSARINKLWGATAQETADFYAQLKFGIRGTDFEVRELVGYIEKAASNIGVNTRELMQQIVDSGEEFYATARDGGKQFVRAAAALVRAKLDITAISSMASSMVSSFEGFLEKQASLQSYFPGLDLTNVMMESQFGDVASTARALQASLLQSGITDIREIPRSIRDSLAASVGLPLSQLTRVLDADLSAISDADIEQMAEMSPEAQSLARLLTSSDAMVEYLKSIATNISTIAAAPFFSRFSGNTTQAAADENRLKINRFGAWGGLASGAAAGALVGGLPGLGIGGLLGAIGGLTSTMGAQRILLGSSAQESSRISEYSRKMSENKFHIGGIAGNPRNNEDVPAMLQRGEAVLTRAQTSGLERLINSVSMVGVMGDRLEEFVKYNNETTNNNTPQRQVKQDNDDVVAKLNELIMLMKNGGLAVHMDGRKVGETLASAFSRG